MGHREDNGDRIVLRDYTGRLVGEYIPSENTTRDHTGRAIGFGDLLGTLLRG
jgi:hypothetical protein